MKKCEGNIIYQSNNYYLVKNKEEIAIVEYDFERQHYKYIEVEGDLKLFLIKEMQKQINSLKCYLFNTDAAKYLDFLSSLYVYAFCQGRH